MDKRETINLLVRSRELFPDRKSRHDWVRAKQILNGRPIKVPMAVPKERSWAFHRTYKEANGCQIYRSEFSNNFRVFDIFGL